MADNKSTQAAIEREVQRRVTEYLASAGLPQGQLSLQILFMLPKEFVDAYSLLFSLSLKELGRPNDNGRTANPVKRVVNRTLRDKDQTKGRRGLRSVSRNSAETKPDPTSAHEGQRKPLTEQIEASKKIHPSTRVSNRPGSTEQKQIGIFDRGGKTYKEYWVIRDEAALKLKGSLDRKLLRMAADVERFVEEHEGGD